MSKIAIEGTSLLFDHVDLQLFEGGTIGSTFL